MEIHIKDIRVGYCQKDIYTEVKRFHQKHSDVDFEQFLTTKFALWIDTDQAQKIPYMALVGLF